MYKWLSPFQFSLGNTWLFLCIRTRAVLCKHNTY